MGLQIHCSVSSLLFKSKPSSVTCLPKKLLHQQKGKRMTPENPSVSELVSSLRVLSKIFSVILPSCPSNFQKALQNLSQSSIETSPSTKSSLSKLSRNSPLSHKSSFSASTLNPSSPKNLNKSSTTKKISAVPSKMEKHHLKSTPPPEKRTLSSEAPPPAGDAPP